MKAHSTSVGGQWGSSGTIERKCLPCSSNTSSVHIIRMIKQNCCEGERHVSPSKT